LSGYEPLTRGWTVVRAACLALRLSPRFLAQLGFLLPGSSGSGGWFAFVYSYSFWRGVAAASGSLRWWGNLREPWTRADGA
jgi:hypothetical protein